MTLSRAVAALALVATATACAAVGKPIADSSDPVGGTSPQVQPIVTASTVERPGVELQPADDLIGQSDSVTTSTTAPEATSTTAQSVPTGESTTTTTTETIDLDAVFDALDALEGMFGELEAEVGSIDLEEGENP